jgi:histone chaperone ASF1
MSLVNIINVIVLDNPTAFTNPFQFEITFQCDQELQDGKLVGNHLLFENCVYILHSHVQQYYLCECSFLIHYSSIDLEWKVTYVGSAEDTTRDQILEEVMVGPVSVGVNKFVLQASPPNPDMIPEGDLLGVTVILVTCSYLDQEFIRIGYYVNNEPSEPYDPENPPTVVDISTVVRNILADQPRVTRIPINWNGAAEQTLTSFNEDGGASIQMSMVEMHQEDSMDVERMQEIIDASRNNESSLSFAYHS